MNVERMLYLADQLENPTDPSLRNLTFDMSDFGSCPSVQYRYVRVEEAFICGTSACIGGHACVLFGGRQLHDMEARRLLDLDHIQAGKLFYNSEMYIASKVLPDITREEAAAAVRRMVQEYIDQTVAKMEPHVEEAAVEVLQG